MFIFLLNTHVDIQYVLIKSDFLFFQTSWVTPQSFHVPIGNCKSTRRTRTALWKTQVSQVCTLRGLGLKTQYPFDINGNVCVAYQNSFYWMPGHICGLVYLYDTTLIDINVYMIILPVWDCILVTPRSCMTTSVRTTSDNEELWFLLSNEKRFLWKHV